MNDYKSFLETKKKTFISSGFEIDESELNQNLFDFQKYIVKTALSKKMELMRIQLTMIKMELILVTGVKLQSLFG